MEHWSKVAPGVAFSMLGSGVARLPRAGVRGMIRGMIFQFAFRRLLPMALLPALVAGAAAAEFVVADAGLKVVRIDSAAKEEFTALALDAAGRIFVGGGRTVWVYEPAPQGLYLPKKVVGQLDGGMRITSLVVRGGDVWGCAGNALFRMPGAGKGGLGAKAERLVWGVPEANGAGEFHGLAVGPEGDLYVQHGDPFAGEVREHWGRWTWQSANGSKLEYTGTGGVLRVKPDGSGVQVVARGQRDGGGLTFDPEWNLFSTTAGEPGRVLHVVPGADFSRPGGVAAERGTNRADLLGTMIAAPGRAGLGGIAVYHDTFLPEKYRGSLLVANAGEGVLARFPLERNGATFQARALPLLTSGDARFANVAVGRGGRIFLTATVKEGAEVRRQLLMLTRAEDKAGAPFDGYEETTATEAKLFEELSSPDWSRRQRAHGELMRRGGRVYKAAAVLLAGTKLGSVAVPHLMWIAGAAQTQQVAGFMALLFEDERENVCVQAARVACEYGLGTPPSVWRAKVRDPNPDLVLAALTALADQPGKDFDPIIDGPGRSDDAYLRQAAARLLAQQAPRSVLEKLGVASNPARRLLGVLAVGFRLTVPGATNALPAGLKLGGADPGSDPGAVMGSFTTADYWRATKGGPEAEALFAMLVRMMKDENERVRFMAAHFLQLLDDPRGAARVAEVLGQAGR